MKGCYGAVASLCSLDLRGESTMDLRLSRVKLWVKAQVGTCYTVTLMMEFTPHTNQRSKYKLIRDG